MFARRTLLAILALALGSLATAVIAGAPDARANERAVGIATPLVTPLVTPTAPASAPAHAKRVARVTTADLVAPEANVPFGRWHGLSFGAYLSPTSNFVAEDGGVDVVFHFHAGQMADKQIKESGLNAVFVSCGFGLGSGKYAAAFANPERFQRMLGELVKNLEKATGKRGLHVRKLALASWSAGFAAVGKILGVDRYYAMVDTVILNDSLHSQYVGPNPTLGGFSTSRGSERVDLKMIGSFVRFARDAASGSKAMTITHSAIIPPDYASSAEATDALLGAIDVRATMTKPEDEAPSALWRGMTLTKRADSGNLRVRGFGGAGPRDHFQHLYLIGEALRSSVVVRWKRQDRLVYTLAGEQL